MTLQLRQSEIERVTESPGVDFHRLAFDVQKMVATFVMMERGDEKSLEIADLLRMNNPNLNGYAVIVDV